MTWFEHIESWWAMWRNRRAYDKVGNAFMWLAATHSAGDGDEHEGMDLLICALEVLDKEYNEL